MTRAYWLVKSEPSKYSFAHLVKDGRTVWDGVRNYEARNALRTMTVGDLILVYHSNEEKAVVGVARVMRAAYQDPTTEDETWSAVDIVPVSALTTRVTLAMIRSSPVLASMAMLRRNRLSVTPLTTPEFEEILRLAGTSLRRLVKA